nr:hypothetical protein [Clostridia bacterium]
MKNKLWKRALCVVLSVVMALSLFVSAVGAASDVSPVIFVLGIWENALYSDPQTDSEYRLFPPTQGEALEVGTHFMVDVILGSQGDEFSKASTEAMNTASNMLTPILCQPTGESKALNIAPRSFPRSLDNYTPSQLGGALTKVAENIGSRVGAENCYVFTYDFRLYPQLNGSRLNDFVKHVKADSGASKVRIFAAGFGGIVANAYLYAFPDEAAADVCAVEFFTSLIGGTRLMGDIMKGNLAYTLEDMTDADEVETSLEAFVNLYGNARGSAFIRWINDLPTTIRADIQNYFKDEVEAQYSTIFKLGATFTIWLTNYIVNKDQIWTDAGLNYDIYIRWAQANMYDAYLKDLLKYTPGFWAMVPIVDYREGLDYMFSDEVIDATLEKNLKEYYLIQNMTRNTLGTAKANGINITLLAGYNLQLLPVTAHMGGQSDSLVDTTYASLGASSPQLNDYWFRSTAQCKDKTHDHMSRDDWEDA